MKNLRVTSSAFKCCLCKQNNGVHDDPTLYSTYTGTPDRPAQSATWGYPGCPPRPKTPFVNGVEAWTHTTKIHYMVGPAQIIICCDHHTLLRDECEAYKIGPLQCKMRGCGHSIYYIPPVTLHLQQHVTRCSASHEMPDHEYKGYIHGERKCADTTCLQTLIAKPAVQKQWNIIVVICSNGHMVDNLCFQNMRHSGRRQFSICRKTFSKEFITMIPTKMPCIGPSDALQPHTFEMSLGHMLYLLQTQYHKAQKMIFCECFPDELQSFQKPLFESVRSYLIVKWK